MIKILSIGCLLMLISISACIEVAAQDPNCSYVQNLSENMTVRHSGMIMVGKIMVPTSHYETEYHTYLVCLNGSSYDAGWR